MLQLCRQLHGVHAPRQEVPGRLLQDLRLQQIHPVQVVVVVAPPPGLPLGGVRHEERHGEQPGRHHPGHVLLPGRRHQAHLILAHVIHVIVVHGVFHRVIEEFFVIRVIWSVKQNIHIPCTTL